MYKYAQNSPVVVLEPVLKHIHKLEVSVDPEPKRLKLQQQQQQQQHQQQQRLHHQLQLQQPITMSALSAQQQQQGKQSCSSTTLHHDSLKGTFTPLTTTNSYDGLIQKPSTVSMINEQHFTTGQQLLGHMYSQLQLITVSSSFDCPCGHLHGPGQGHHEDIGAIGFAHFPLLRGPD